MYIGNYVLYESYQESLKKNENRVTELSGQHMRTQRFYEHWNEKGYPIIQKINHFRDRISAKEQISPGEAIAILEDTYFYQLMNEYPQLLEESVDFWYECYCMEKEADVGEMMGYICENCQWDLF